MAVFDRFRRLVKPQATTPDLRKSFFLDSEQDQEADETSPEISRDSYIPPHNWRVAVRNAQGQQGCSCEQGQMLSSARDNHSTENSSIVEISKPIPRTIRSIANIKSQMREEGFHIHAAPRVKVTGLLNRSVTARQIGPAQISQGERVTTSSTPSASQHPQNPTNPNLLGDLSELQSTTATVVNSRPAPSGTRNRAQTTQRPLLGSISNNQQRLGLVRHLRSRLESGINRLTSTRRRDNSRQDQPYNNDSRPHNQV